MRRVLAMSVLAALAAACGQPADQAASTASITGDDYHGKKYYFGWGEYLSGFMGNETKYDVLHTHNIFTRDVGGDYIGRKLIDEDFGRSDIRSAWREIGAQIQPGDMYLQYSSGHGSTSGLQVGVSYREIRDQVLTYPVNEAVVFTMSCYSGNIVDSFNQRRSEWENWQSQGKTLFVMASSQSDEESSTGPGRDRDEPGGPNGSAGSAYGHALWKALIGYSDGAIDSKKDGTLTLDEIIAYVVEDTQREGGHTPVYTGSYNPKLAIAKVPTVEEAASILGDSEIGRSKLRELINDGVIH